MPYIVVKSNHQETDRRELFEMLVVGRAPDCDLVVRDIALSRRHCRIEPTDDGWAILDLGSKNGTSVNGLRLSGESKPLKDLDTIRLGRSKIVFHEGVPEEDLSQRLMQPARPLDPHEALIGTVAGFTLLPPGETEACDDQPLPRPEPRVPASLEGEELQELLTAIASSSWDSIYASARKPTRPSATNLGEDEPRRRVARPRSPIDLSLQVPLTPVDEPSEGEALDEALAIPETPVAAPVRPVIAAPPRRTPRRWRVFSAARKPRWNRAAITVSLIVLALLGRYCYFLLTSSPSVSMVAQVTASAVQPPQDAPAPAMDDATMATAHEEDVAAAPAQVQPAPSTQPQVDPVYFDSPPLEQRIPFLLDLPLPHELEIGPSDVETIS